MWNRLRWPFEQSLQNVYNEFSGVFGDLLTDIPNKITTIRTDKTWSKLTPLLQTCTFDMLGLWYERRGDELFVTRSVPGLIEFLGLDIVYRTMCSDSNQALDEFWSSASVVTVMKHGICLNTLIPFKTRLEPLFSKFPESTIVTNPDDIITVLMDTSTIQCLLTIIDSQDVLSSVLAAIRTVLQCLVPYQSRVVTQSSTNGVLSARQQPGLYFKKHRERLDALPNKHDFVTMFDTLTTDLQYDEIKPIIMELQDDPAMVSGILKAVVERLRSNKTTNPMEVIQDLVQSGVLDKIIQSNNDDIINSNHTDVTNTVGGPSPDTQTLLHSLTNLLPTQGGNPDVPDMVTMVQTMRSLGLSDEYVQSLTSVLPTRSKKVSKGRRVKHRRGK